MAESTAVGKSGKKDDIKIKSTIEFFRTQFNSFRAELCTISGVPYVGIVKFWQPENCDHFVSQSISAAFATFASEGIDMLLIFVILVWKY